MFPVHYPQRDVPPAIIWAKLQGTCGSKFSAQSGGVWAFQRAWEKTVIHKVCLATLGCHSSDPHLEFTVSDQILDAVGPDVSVVVLLALLMCLWRIQLFWQWVWAKTNWMSGLEPSLIKPGTAVEYLEFLAVLIHSRWQSSSSEVGN